MRAAFIGLGVMGFPMAGHLQREGHPVTVYNRTHSKADAWVAQFGGRAAPTPAAAADGAEIVFTCVGNDDDLRAVVLGEAGAFAGMAGGAILVDHTTASAEIARTVAGLAAERLALSLMASGEGAPAARRYGSAGREYMDLARGALDFASYARLKPWDHAAGVLIHREAGGFSALRSDGSPYRPAPCIVEDTLLLAPDEGSWRRLHALLG
jgi:3-hydroxyisobutyrate dehydrogenase